MAEEDAVWSVVKRNPDTLYNLALTVGAEYCEIITFFCKKEFRNLPNNVLLDFYYQMLQDKRLCFLGFEMEDLNVFKRLLYVKIKRRNLLKIFGYLMDHETQSLQRLTTKYLKYLAQNSLAAIDLGLQMAEFFNEGSWFLSSIQILNTIETSICEKLEKNPTTLKKLLECYQLKLYSESIYCEFNDAQKTFEAALDTVEKLQALNECPNLAGLYANISLMYFIKSEYNKAFPWSQDALKQLSNEVPLKTVIQVLRIGSRSCVVKRNFTQAGLLIKQAVNLAEILYKKDHLPHFSDTLIDYGFYLLNFDFIKESVMVYERALDIRKQVFETNNIQVALGHEDLAYALYVHEYSSGFFKEARQHADKSINIMEKVLPKDHLMLASVKRVKALILEEIALDERSDIRLQKDLLSTAETLHKIALELSFKAFGETNVQTAKHYGNLGRLYQSMKIYDEAENMHLKAIAIKEKLLGKDDYEVGLSIGHLASLYNYHMKRYTDAETLYLRSININLKLFGESYSGLEYDYRGLIHIYERLDPHNMVVYMQKMRDWKRLRQHIQPIEHKEKLLPLSELVSMYFKCN